MRLWLWRGFIYQVAREINIIATLYPPTLRILVAWLIENHLSAFQNECKCLASFSLWWAFRWFLANHWMDCGESTWLVKKWEMFKENAFNYGFNNQLFYQETIWSSYKLLSKSLVNEEGKKTNTLSRSIWLICKREATSFKVISMTMCDGKSAKTTKARVKYWLKKVFELRNNLFRREISEVVARFRVPRMQKQLAS